MLECRTTGVTRATCQSFLRDLSLTFTAKLDTFYARWVTIDMLDYLGH